MAAEGTIGPAENQLRRAIAFYEKLAPKVFRSSLFHIPGWGANFDGAAL